MIIIIIIIILSIQYYLSYYYYYYYFYYTFSSPLQLFYTTILVIWLLTSFSHVSKTLLCILADLNYAVTSMVLIFPLIFNSCTLFSKPFESVPSAPTTIDITDTFVCHSFSVLWPGPRILFSFIFTRWLTGTAISSR